jgi:phage terminase large subunit GpA-like protein
MTNINRTIRRAFSSYKPPEDITVSQWAAKYRVLSRENAAEAGRWRNSRTPYLVDIMDSFTDPRVKKITVASGSQVGKSELLNNIMGYIIHQDPASTLFVQPTVDDAKKYSRLRIAPMIRDSDPLRERVADVKTRDSGNTMLQKKFPGGMLTMVGSNSPSGLASTPCKYVLGDERDRWALSAGTEGDPWKLAEARTTTFYNAKMVEVSTPTIKGASAIEKGYNAGTRERWCHQCPDCGEWVELCFDDFKFQFETIKQDRNKKDFFITETGWCCPCCGTLHTEEEMRAAPVKWIAQNPDAIKNGHRSFKLSAFASPWVSWESIAYKFLISKDDPAQLQTFYNTVLGDWWEDRGGTIDNEEAMSRREDYGTCADGSPVELPEGVLVLTCGVDTQNDRLEYEVVGHGFYGETWGIKKGICMGDPNTDAPWQRLDDVIDHTYTFKDGKGLKLSITFVDSGGLRTQDVYTQCRARLSKRVFAIKGQGGDGVPFTKPPTKIKQVVNGKMIGQLWLYSLGVDAGKADVMNNIRVQEPGPKYCHFPLDHARGYDSRYFEGLLSEKLVQKTTNGRTRWAWEKISEHIRNEPLDCRVYALAAFRVLDPDLEAVAARLRAATTGEQQPQLQRQARPKVKKSTVQGYW